MDHSLDDRQATSKSKFLAADCADYADRLQSLPFTCAVFPWPAAHPRNPWLLLRLDMTLGSEPTLLKNRRQVWEDNELAHRGWS